ncbi:helix-turn-helix domain-containing protein [Streptomyces sp. NPDC059262]|uniref:helix-turn-helix domain-containing protein n=1 Tax=Streptomyces sp. NPDC059262 TaxID=3346797 RepID=UPI0036D0BB3E
MSREVRFLSSEEVLTVKQVAEILKISEKTARKMLNNGEIKGFKVGREWRVSAEKFNEYLKQN